MKDSYKPITDNSRKGLPSLLRVLWGKRDETQQREFDRNKDSLARFRKEVANREKLNREDS